MNLLPFQKQTIKKMIDIETNNYFPSIPTWIYNFAFLTSCAGSGKTQCILELCKHASTGVYIHHILNIHNPLLKQFNYRQTEAINIHTNIIVVHYSVFGQWKHAISDFSSNATFISQQRDLIKLSDMFCKYHEYETRESRPITSLFEKSKYEIPDIILISNTLFSQFTFPKEWFIFNRIIFDDFSHLETEQINIYSRFFWFIDSRIDDNQPNIFNYLKRAISHEMIQHINVYMSKNLINKYIIPIQNACINFELCKYDNNEEIAKSILGNKQNCVKNLFTLQSKIAHQDNVNYLSKLIELGNLTEANKQKLDNIISRYNQTTCTICMGNIDKSKHSFYLSPCCYHLFCFSCIHKSILYNLHNCAMCRKNMFVSMATYIKKRQSTFAQSIIKTIKQINDNSHIILYLDSTQSKIIKKEIEKNTKMTIKLLKGNVNIINSYIENFENGEINILVVDKLMMDYGIDLKHAKHLIISTTQNIDIINRIIGKCQRIGRTCPLNIQFIDNISNDFDISSLDYEFTNIIQRTI